jgi:hypothetical protein
MALSKFDMSFTDMDDIVAAANQTMGPAQAMADGVTMKQAMRLDNDGHQPFECFNPHTNQDTPADKVQRMFSEGEDWKKSPTYPFPTGTSPVQGKRGY